MPNPTQEEPKVAVQTVQPNNSRIGTRPHHGRTVLLIALVAAAGVLISGIWSRVTARSTLRAETAQIARPSVSVVTPKASKPVEEIVLPGNVQPFITSPIYARTSGYLRTWYADIGAHVKKGQLLAVIEAPELDQQLEQSMS